MNLAGQASVGRQAESGYAMAALLVSIGVLSVLMSVAMPVWRQAVQREKEAELIFRGEQYAHAIALYQRKFAGAFPPSIDLLVQQKFLRRKYKDPMTESGEFQVLYQMTAQAQPGSQRPGQPGAQPPPTTAAPSTGFGQRTGSLGSQGGVVGVVSKSTANSIRLYKGRGKYNEWQFVHVPTSAQPGAAPGAQPQPGIRPGVQPGGQPGQPRPGGLQPPGPRPGGLQPRGQAPLSPIGPLPVGPQPTPRPPR